MNTIKLIIKFINGAIAVLDKAITSENAKALAADKAAFNLRTAADAQDQLAIDAREQSRQATVLLGKLNSLIEG